MFNRFMGAILACLMLAGAAFGQANPPVGTPPGTGPQLIDGQWLTGLAGGRNEAYISGITAAGTTQANATQLPSGFALIEVDTAASGTGVNLPPCFPGTEFSVHNNGANAIKFYPTVANNPLTAAQDTINGTTSFTGGTPPTPSYFGCAKAGVWSAK